MSPDGSTPTRGARPHAAPAGDISRPARHPRRRLQSTYALLALVAVFCALHLAAIAYGLSQGGPFIALAAFGAVMLAAAAVIVPRGLTADRLHE